MSNLKINTNIKSEGMLIYNQNSGKIEPIDDNNEDTRNIYRKYIKSGGPGENEWIIINKLFELGKNIDYDKNLIKILHFSEDEIGKYYDINVVDTYINIKIKCQTEKLVSLYEQLTKLNKTRRYLQNNGIAYIDWKLNNIGLNSDGEIILYDFDSSGTFILPNPVKNIKGQWIVSPPVNSYNYKYATTIFSKYSCENYPQNLDTFLFRNMLFNANNKQTDLPLN